MKEPICKLNMGLMSMAYKQLITLMTLCLVVLLGCSSKAPMQRFTPSESLRTDSTNCLQKYQIALLECQLFVSNEKNLSKKDKQTIKCLNNKHFPSGMKSCT